LPNFPSNLPYLFGQISDYLFKDVAEHLTLWKYQSELLINFYLNFYFLKKKLSTLTCVIYFLKIML
jgi:hypothetical protein